MEPRDRPEVKKSQTFVPYLFIDEESDFGCLWTMEDCLDAGTPISEETGHDLTLIGAAEVDENCRSAVAYDSDGVKYTLNIQDSSYHKHQLVSE